MPRLDFLQFKTYFENNRFRRKFRSKPILFRLKKRNFASKIKV